MTERLLTQLAQFGIKVALDDNGRDLLISGDVGDDDREQIRSCKSLLVAALTGRKTSLAERPKLSPTESATSEPRPLKPGEVVVLVPGHPAAAFVWDDSPADPKPTVQQKSAERSWDTPTANAIAWLSRHRQEVRQAPFHLGNGARVVSRDKFLGALDHDIETGPGGIRAEVLIHDIRAIRGALEGVNACA